MNMPVLEITHHLRLVTTTHPMFSLAVDCLKNVDTERPSAQHICHFLSALKETPQYIQSLEAGEGGERWRHSGEGSADSATPTRE